MEIIIGLLGITFIFYLSCLKWRRTVKAVIFLVVFEGALRKWVLPQASEMIYFLKDIVLLGAYVGYYGGSDFKKKIYKENTTIKILTFMLAGWCLFQAFNPSLGSPIVGCFGVKAYLYYVPLMWIIPAMFQSEAELYKFWRTQLLLVIPIGILGIAQFFSPASSPLNVYANQKLEVATFGSAGLKTARITGTFAYLTGYGVYLTICFGLLIAMLSIKKTKGWWWLYVIEIFFVIVNSFMTGSRTTILNLVLFLLGYIAVRWLRKPTSTLRLIGKFLLPGLAVGLAALIWFAPAINAFSKRTTSNHDLNGRISSEFTEPLEFIKYKQLDGYGTGATHQATPVLRKILNLPPGELIPTYFEGELGRIALELGPIGFLLWYGLRISIAIALLRTFWKLKRPLLREFALTAFFIHAININAHLVFQTTLGIYYWFFSGFIYLLPRLEQIENWEREQQLLQENVIHLP